MDIYSLWTVIHTDTGEPVVPFDANPGYPGDEGMLVYRSLAAAQAASKHQDDLYELSTKPEQLVRLLNKAKNRTNPRPATAEAIIAQLRSLAIEPARLPASAVEIVHRAAEVLQLYEATLQTIAGNRLLIVEERKLVPADDRFNETVLLARRTLDRDNPPGDKKDAT